MNNIHWIEINLPWGSPHTFRVPYPDLSKREREEFGQTGTEVMEAFNQLFKDSFIKIESEVEDKLLNLSSVEEMSEDEYNATKNKIWESYKDEPSVIAKNELKKFNTITNDWESSQPEIIEYQKRYNELKQIEDQQSFVGRGLNKPGTLIELQDGKREFIGTINTLRGVCDDCTPFENNAIIKRYAVIVDLTNKL